MAIPRQKTSKFLARVFGGRGRGEEGEVIMFAFRCDNCACVISMGCSWVAVPWEGGEGEGLWNLLAISWICRRQGVFAAGSLWVGEGRREGGREEEGGGREGDREGGRKGGRDKSLLSVVALFRHLGCCHVQSTN